MANIMGMQGKYYPAVTLKQRGIDTIWSTE